MFEEEIRLIEEAKRLAAAEKEAAKWESIAKQVQHERSYLAEALAAAEARVKELETALRASISGCGLCGEKALADRLGEAAESAVEDITKFRDGGCSTFTRDARDTLNDAIREWREARGEEKP